MRSHLRAVAAAVLSACLLGTSLAHAGGAPGDPLERYNRAVFKFNDKVDVWLFEPLAKGWDFILPRVVEESLDDFFENLRFPIVFVNSILQAKPTRAGIALGRFTINTLLGMGGFLDPATSAGLTRVDEDFGQTLGYWGLGGGPYLVLPLLGPSNPRDAVGLVADSATRVWPYFVDPVITYSVTGVNLLNTRALYLDVVRDAKRESLDYYAAVRDAYLQRRQALIEDRSRDEGHEKLSHPEAEDEHAGPKADDSEEDLYFPDID